MIYSSKLKVNMLGGFSIMNGNTVLTDRNSRSKKAWMLLEYLITFRTREISQAELIELLWPDDEITEPANTLKTLAHRLRAMLSELEFADGKDMVLSRGGSYAWNNELPVFIDAEEFDKLCCSAASQSGEDRLNSLRAAIDLFKGDFLPKSSTETWAVPISTYYHSLYLRAVHSATELLESSGLFSEICDICQRAVTIDPYDEDLHHSLIEAYVQLGNNQAAMQHYNSVTEMFMKKFGISPSPELTALYKEIVKTSNTTEMNLQIIRDEMREAAAVPGAFFCEYEFFKDIYRLQARTAARSGQAVHIALITILPAKGQELSRKKINSSMDKLHDVIAYSLRKGDVFTRYSVTQYLIMLPSASMENSEAVLDRIDRRFRQDLPHANILLHFSITPADFLLD